MRLEAISLRLKQITAPVPQPFALGDRRERVAEWGTSSPRHWHFDAETYCYLRLDQKWPKAWRQSSRVAASYDSLKPPLV